MSAPAQKGFEDLLFKYLTSDPLATDVTIKNEMKKVAQPDGSTQIVMVPEKGDAFLPDDISGLLSRAVARALFEQIFKYIETPVVEKVNELIEQYNQLRADFITGGGATTSTEVEKIP